MNKFVLVSGSLGSKTAVSNSQGVGTSVTTEHCWVTVINPTNHRLLLQACDDCGVVKSENSVLRACNALKGRAVISGRMSTDVSLVS